MLILVSVRCDGVIPFFGIRGMLQIFRLCFLEARIDRIDIVVALKYQSLELIL